VRPRYLVPTAVIIVVLMARAYLATEGSTPAAQPSLAHLSGLDALRTEFNRASSQTRAIILLSQTCPYCLKGATTVQRLLDARPQRSLAAFVVWQPILPTDWALPGTSVLHRLSDRRVRQYWDPDRHVAAALAASFSSRDQQPSCCYQKGVWWDMIAVFPPDVQWTGTLPEPLLLEGTVDDAAEAFAALLAGR
jgi:hypothetical protein